MNRMETKFLIAAIIVAVLQVLISHYSTKYGEKSAREELKRDISKIVDTLNSKDRRKLISELNLNKDEIIYLFEKTSMENKSAILSKIEVLDERLNKWEIIFRDYLNISKNNDLQDVDDLLKAKYGYNLKEIQQKARAVIVESESNYLKGLASLVNGDTLQAVEYYNKALENSIDLSLRISALNDLGDIHRLNNEPEKALNFYTKAINSFNELMIKTPEEQYKVGSSLNGFGILLIHNGKDKNDYLKAIEMLNQALEIDRRIVSYNLYEQGLSRTLQNLGIAYKRIEKYGKAKEVVMEALDMAKTETDKLRNSRTVSNLSLLNQNYGLILKLENKSSNIGSEEYLKEAYLLSLEALKLAKEEKKKNLNSLNQNIASSSYNLAQLYIDNEMLDEAFQFYQISKSVYKNLAQVNEDKYNYNLAGCNIGLSMVYYLRAKKSKDIDNVKNFKDKGLIQLLEAKELMKIYKNPQGDIKKTKNRIEENIPYFK